MFARLVIPAGLAAALAGCGPSYSPNTYATDAVQQAAKVDPGIIVGVREVEISASGTTGAVVGGAAGGIAGSQVGEGAEKALTTLGSTLVGGFAGSATEHAISDTRGYEYIIREPKGDLVSVTQKDKVPLAIGQKVLVIAGKQARVVPDYTVAVAPGGGDKPPEASKEANATAPPPQPVSATPLAAPADAETGP
jgi:outer membrane lipoprotein SlyB